MRGDTPPSRSKKYANGASSRSTVRTINAGVLPSEITSGSAGGSVKRCLDEDEVLAFTSGAAPQDLQRVIEEHLGECQACLAWVATLLRANLRETSNALAETMPMLEPGTAGSKVADSLEVKGGDYTARYKIVAKIGSGGMGIVYRAYDQALRRHIALKLIRGESHRAPGPRVRLIAEAHALAQLTHPNVVSVYDLGTIDDQIFIAMELIEGSTLRVYLQKTGAGWREIVARYLDAARGLAAAHTRGLIHRDFKPDNVLVSGARVVVTDFGLVRTLTGEDEKHVEAGPIGTPAYMAPEQWRGEPADERTDIFNFCASAYESLYGEPPFAGDSHIDRRAAVLADRRRAPSTIAGVPRSVHAVLWRGMAHDRADRFSSMNELIDALSHATRRRERALAMSLVVGVGVLAALTAVMWLRRGPVEMCQRRARELPTFWSQQAQPKIMSVFSRSNLPFQQESWHTVETVLNDYVSSWTGLYSQQCEVAFGRKAQSLAAIPRLQCLDERQAAVSELIEVLESGEPDVLTAAVTAVTQLDPPLSCVTTTPPAVTQPTLKTERPRLAIQESHRDLGKALGLQVSGQYERAATAAARALQIAQSIAHAPLEADALFRLASIKKDQGQWSECEHLFGTCIDAAERAGNDLVRARAAIELTDVVGYRESRLSDGSHWAHQAEVVLTRIGNPARELAALMNARALVRQRDGKLDDAEADMRGALTLRQRVLPTNDPLIARTLNNLGIVLQSKAKYVEAESLYRQAYAQLSTILGARHPRSAATLVNIGSVLYATGRFSEAKLEYEQALAAQTAALGLHHPHVATTLTNLANVYDYLGDHQQAINCATRALDIVKASDPDSDQLVGLKLNMANYLAELGQFARAHELADEALASRRNRFGAQHAQTGEVEQWIAEFYLYEHRFAEALEHAQLAFQLIERGLGKENAQLGEILDVIGVAERERGHLAAALESHKRALAIRSLNGGGPEIAATRTNLGLAEIALGSRRQGLADLEQAMLLRAEQEGDPEGRAVTEFALAKSLGDEPKDSARAIRLARAALETFSHAGRRWTSDAQEVRRWIQRREMKLQQGEAR
jgi:serine/threonine protein kinase/tetratricopeptide (TPR) repeat protein